MSHAATRATLMVLQVFVALTAIFGAILVVPTLPREWLRAGPFTDYTIPALVLGVCGAMALIAIVLLAVAPRLGGAASIVAGLFMIAFEVVEIAVVGLAVVVHGAENPQSWLQIVYLVIGAAGMALGYHLWRLEEESRQMARPAH